MKIIDHKFANIRVFFGKIERKVLSLQKIYKYATYNYGS